MQSVWLSGIHLGKIAENCVETCSDFVAVFFMAANACCGVGPMEQIALLTIPAARWTFETISFKRHDTIGGIQICKICFGNYDSRSVAL